ncbi:hypothetical protein RN001_013497 [Aquatica leii]|uniref:Uncharacterized protein n=1 Tax=Aquatica leii TaxID=1421715 RepID=A0AAN7P047_9COLE|nr:hypothetical protein RN001_013497 [Aquatica leii]
MLQQSFHVCLVFYYIFSLWYDQMYVDLETLKPIKNQQIFKGRLQFLTIWNMFFYTMPFVPLLHIAQAIHFWFGCYYDWYYVNVPVEVHSMGVTYGATKKLKFLTFWNALLQATFFTVCVLNNFIGTNEILPKTKSSIRKLRDTMLAALAFPLSMFVGVTFWGIYAIDRELVFPKALDAFFPTWLNHVMHTNIMIFTLLQMYLSYHAYPSRKTCITILSTFMICYLVWILNKEYKNMPNSNIINAFRATGIYNAKTSGPDRNHLPINIFLESDLNKCRNQENNSVEILTTTDNEAQDEPTADPTAGPFEAFSTLTLVPIPGPSNESQTLTVEPLCQDSKISDKEKLLHKLITKIYNLRIF